MATKKTIDEIEEQAFDLVLDFYKDMGRAIQQFKTARNLKNGKT